MTLKSDTRESFKPNQSATIRSGFLTGQRQTMVGFLAVAIVGLFLYLPFLSIQYDFSGIFEVMAIDRGGNDLFNQNHLLNRPVGYLIYQVLRWIGYSGRSVYLFQVLTALSGAIGMGFAFLFYYRLSNSRLMALIASLWLGTTWTYWYYSTDVSHFTPAAMLVAGTLAWFTSPHQSNCSKFGIGIVCALSILTLEFNVFLLLILGIGILLLQQGRSLRSRLVEIAVVGGTCILIVSLTYMAVDALVLGQKNSAELVRTPLSHSAHLPMWGQLDLHRVPQAAKSAIGSLWGNLGVGRLIRGSTRSAGILGLLSALGTIVLAVWSIRKLLFQVSSGTARLRLLLWTVAGYAIWVPFIIWWEPFTRKWFIIPNIFLIGTLAVVWNRNVKKRDIAVLFAYVMIMAMANFASTIWPQHTQASPDYEMAACVASHTDERDSIIATGWTWEHHLEYFHRRKTLFLIYDRVHLGSKAKVFDKVRQLISETQQQGGHVYMIDVNSDPLTYAFWPIKQAGFTTEDFLRFKYEPAFTCKDVKFERMIEFK